MVYEVALAELVLDELVRGAAIRYPQQGFREHHQREPLLGRERELAKHVLDAAEPVVVGAYRIDQTGRVAVDPLVLFGAEVSGLEKPGRDDAIVRRVQRIEGRKRSFVGGHRSPSFPDKSTPLAATVRWPRFWLGK